MAIVPRRSRSGGPESPIASLRHEMERMLEQTLGAEDIGAPTWPGAAWTPSIDVHEDENEIRIEAEVPGVDPEKIDVSVTNHMLTIEGQKEESTEKRDGDFYHTERRFGSFRRSIQLPDNADVEKVEAHADHGVLKVRVPKGAERGRRRISIRSGDGR